MHTRRKVDRILDSSVYQYEYQYGYVAGDTGKSNPPSVSLSAQIGEAYNAVLGSEPKPKLYINGYHYSEDAWAEAWP